MGTTRGTNALLERKGAPTVLVTTKGFADLLLIRNQDRPDLFDLNISKAAPLFASVLEVDERVSAQGEVLRPLDLSGVAAQLAALRRQGMRSVAIALLNSYRTPDHELALEDVVREVGFEEVSCSSRVSPTIKFIPRAETTVLDAYLTPVLRSYVAEIRESLSAGSRLRLMTSHGGLVEGALFSGKDSILSGPAGGVVAFARIGEAAGFTRSIGFDMGGTSTDVSRYGGEFEIQSETLKAGVHIASPTLAIETVAAGGGSVCRFDGVQLQVGPDSAGAEPGPACYGRGGPLTVTDMNVVLGRILPDQFPFPLQLAPVYEQLETLCEAILNAGGKQYTIPELAQGFIDIANETMARAIRKVSIQRGFHPREHLLVSFGGAGGQHACAMARSLGMSTILIHPFAGILSAYGMGLADVRKREEVSLLELYDDCLEVLPRRFAAMEEKLKRELLQEGVKEFDSLKIHRSLSLRYQGLDATIVITDPPGENFVGEYIAEHQRLYGYHHPDRDVEVVNVIVEVVSLGASRTLEARSLSDSSPRSTLETTEIWNQGQLVNARVFTRAQLAVETEVQGPALICDAGSTVWIEPEFVCQVQTDGTLIIQMIEETQDDSATVKVSEDIDVPDLILLEVFNNQFASIAEQMGETLQRTAVSTNVKERLDYSCAIFDSTGGLVVNAPHIPVHLGAMGETVKSILNSMDDLRPGDVVVTNDPYAGGSHLPDVTVVTPLFDQQTGELLFLTASRAHHAEIGGIRPGSMPPFSKNLAEEGVLIRQFKLVDGGASQEAGLKKLLTSGPYPTRNLRDNLADLSAQVAANRFGQKLLEDLIQRAGRDTVLRYMRFIQAAAHRKMELALAAIPDGLYEFSDYLDNGARISVSITIQQQRAIVDFTGTDPVLDSNLNANRAIVTAACMYVFRSLIYDSIPLNSGVLEPIEILLPESLLNPPRHQNPSQCAAIVGGNVETSQRVVDVLLGALGKAAASQGTMNNLTFGNDQFGYYETICGGAGATVERSGADAVHTHMTNTRLTDVEVIENRYPVQVEEFSIRQGSGGAGLHAGGSGIVRRFCFLEPLKVSLLTQRRGEYLPFGLQGGSPGAPGQNLLKRAGVADFEDLGGAAQFDVNIGDQLEIRTPGGGGFGLEVPTDSP